jgi:HSP20 family protein
MSKNALTKVKGTFPGLLNDFFKPWDEWFDNGVLPTRTLTVPAVNISEEADSYNVTLAVPGMKKEDFDVDVNANIVTISAETESETEDDDKKYSRKEYNYSSFSRSFTLPENVIGEKIEAGYENGVLTVVLPKKEETKDKSKKVTVK